MRRRVAVRRSGVALLGAGLGLAARATHAALEGRVEEEAKLLASDGAANDYFGYSVALSGTYALVSAHGNADNGSASGSAYV